MDTNEKIEKIKQMPLTEANAILQKLPKGMRAKLYAKSCNNEQIGQLLTAWDELGNVPMIEALIKRLVKKKRTDAIPEEISEKYKYLL